MTAADLVWSLISAFITTVVFLGLADLYTRHHTPQDPR